MDPASSANATGTPKLIESPSPNSPLASSEFPTPSLSHSATRPLPRSRTGSLLFWVSSIGCTASYTQLEKGHSQELREPQTCSLPPSLFSRLPWQLLLSSRGEQLPKKENGPLFDPFLWKKEICLRLCGLSPLPGWSRAERSKASRECFTLRACHTGRSNREPLAPWSRPGSWKWLEWRGLPQRPL